MVVLEEKRVYTSVTTNVAIAGFRRVRFDDEFDLLVHHADGFFNVTDVFEKARPPLKFIEYQHGKWFQELETLLLERLEFCQRVRYTNRDLGHADGSAVRGTYYHPILFLAVVADWCDKEIYVKAAIVVNGFFDKSAERRSLFDRTFALKPTMTPKSSPRSKFLKLPKLPDASSVTRVTYEGFELLVDERGWFNASKFCCEYAKDHKLESFSRTTYFDRIVECMSRDLKLVPVRERLDVDRTAPEHGKFYHPLLFLSLANWISFDCYVNVSRIAFAYFSPCESRRLRHGESLKLLADTTTPHTSDDEEDNDDDDDDGNDDDDDDDDDGDATTSKKDEQSTARAILALIKSNIQIKQTLNKLENNQNEILSLLENNRRQ